MKKLLTILALCLCAFSGFSQLASGWAYIDAVGTTGSFKTGYTRAAAGRTSGNPIIASSTTVRPRRGYAVFNLTGVVPPGAIIDSVYIRFNFRSSTTGTTDACTIYADSLDLSTVTTSAPLYTAINSGTLVNTTNWGELVSATATLQDRLPFSGAGISFVNTFVGTIMSVGFSATSGANVYTMIGLSGTATTIPQLQIKYHCSDVSGVLGTVSADPACGNSVLTLTGSATGASSYSWAGPGGTISTSAVTSTTVLYPASTGVYSFTATGASGCSITDTVTVRVLSGPTPIVGVSSACMGAPLVLGDDSTTGTWAITPSSVASITAGGIVTLSSPGTAIASYSFADGCTVYDTISVTLPAPTPITGSPTVCDLLNDPLTDGIIGGTWSSSSSGIASVDPSTGVVTAASVGSTIITYSTGCLPNQYFTVTVDSLPDPISIPSSLCQYDTVTATNASPAGYWTSSSATATIDSTTGLVTGVNGSVVTITYSFYTNNCYSTAPLTIMPAPIAITGNDNVCIGGVDTLADSVLGGIWTSSDTNKAIINSGTGIISGRSFGTVVITYANNCGSAYYTVYSDTLPDAIAGAPNVCFGTPTTLTDGSPGGIWRSADTAIAFAAAGLGVITGNTVGTTTITYELPTGCFVTQQFTVNPVPPAMTGQFHACPGTSVTLHDGLTGGSYSSSNFYIASTVPASGLITGVNVGECTITYSMPTGCSTTEPFTIYPNPEPITGRNIVCDSLSDTLFDATDSGTWHSSNTSVVTIRTVYPDTGFYFANSTASGYTDSSIITYVLPYTGCLASYTVIVHPSPRPVITFNIADSTYSTGTFYVSYQWYENDTIIQGATSYNMAALFDLDYSVKVVDTFGCVGYSPFSHYNLGVGTIVGGNNVKIYPNPAGSEIIVDAPASSKVSISDIQGKELISGKEAGTIDISSLTPGIYLVGVYNKAGELMIFEKLVKQ